MDLDYVKMVNLKPNISYNAREYSKVRILRPESFGHYELNQIISNKRTGMYSIIYIAQYYFHLYLFKVLTTDIIWPVTGRLWLVLDTCG